MFSRGAPMFFALVVVGCIPEPQTPPEATTPTIVQVVTPPTVVNNITINAANVSFSTTNIYFGASREGVAAPSVEIDAAEDAAPALARADACDQYVAATRRCGRAVTSSPVALAALDHTLEDIRSRARATAGSADETARSELTKRCEAALRAYDFAPCPAR